ncbi:N-acetylmuramidase domain-containing protein, partial [Spirosoma harenae]
VHEFVDFLKTGESAQLMAFCKFLISKVLDKKLRKGDLNGFCIGYNGNDAIINGYPKKIAARVAWHTANP